MDWVGILFDVLFGGSILACIVGLYIWRKKSIKNKDEAFITITESLLKLMVGIFALYVVLFALSFQFEWLR